MNSLIFKIDGLPPSYNKSCKINYNFKEVSLSNEARYFKVRVKMAMQPLEISDNCYISLLIGYHSNWYFKNGSLRKIDIQNMDKLLHDAICEKLGLDDSRIWSYSSFKYQDTINKPFTEVRIEFIPTQESPNANYP
jgi:Holliday junction resolvase RusA-like endonuclease